MGAAGQRVWRVLIVDDEENLNWSLVNSLRKDAYAADGAMTGDEALRLLTAQSYDIVISDVKMPGMDGFELLQWLRANRPQTRIVMMTAFGSPTDRNEALRSGAIAYMEKPFDLRALKDQLRRMTSPTSGSVAPNAAQTEGYDLLEVARVINLARRDIALRVESGGRTGTFRFSGGELVWAESGELQGDDAFVALTVSRTGHAQPEVWDGRSVRYVTQSLSRLIPLVLSRRDQPPRGDTGGPAGRTTPQPNTTSAGPAGAAPVDRPAQGREAPAAQQGPAAGPTMQPGSTAPPAFPRAAPIEPVAATAPLARLTEGQIGTIKKVVEMLAVKLPVAGGVAFLRPDGVVVDQRWNGSQQEAPSGALLHLAACAQSALRALLIAGWGDLEHVEIDSRDRKLLVCRFGRGDRAGVLVTAVPSSEDLAPVRAQVEQLGASLTEALH